MRTLIDGYNLMHAIGLLSRTFGPDGFRKVRHRFLNDLAAKLDPVEAHQTTIVFDANDPPPGRPEQLRHKGLTVIFAVGDDDADTRLEYLIAHHSAPKGLTVVSSDHRIKDAGRRRKAKVLTADDYWSQVTGPRFRKVATPPAPPSAEERGRREGPSPAESEFWQAAFGGLDEAPETREALRDPDDGFLPSEEEIARIAREVDREPF